MITLEQVKALELADRVLAEISSEIDQPTSDLTHAVKVFRQIDHIRDIRVRIAVVLANQGGVA